MFSRKRFQFSIEKVVKNDRAQVAQLRWGRAACRIAGLSIKGAMVETRQAFAAVAHERYEIRNTIRLNLKLKLKRARQESLQ